MGDFSRDNYIHNVDILAKAIRNTPKDSKCSAALKGLLIDEVGSQMDLKLKKYDVSELVSKLNQISEDLGWFEQHGCKFREE